jgi:hypothetical protein
VAIDREAAVIHRPDEGVAGRKPHIDFGLVGGLETVPANLDHHHVVAVLGFQHVLGDVPQIGNMFRDRRFARVNRAVGCRPKNVPREGQRIRPLRFVGVAVPEAVIAGQGAFGEARDDHVDEPIVSDGQRISDPVDRDE